MAMKKTCEGGVACCDALFVAICYATGGGTLRIRMFKLQQTSQKVPIATHSPPLCTSVNAID